MCNDYNTHHLFMSLLQITSLCDIDLLFKADITNGQCRVVLQWWPFSGIFEAMWRLVDQDPLLEWKWKHSGRHLSFILHSPWLCMLHQCVHHPSSMPIYTLKWSQWQVEENIKNPECCRARWRMRHSAAEFEWNKLGHGCLLVGVVFFLLRHFTTFN